MRTESATVAEMPKKTALLNMRIDPEVKEAAEKAAAEDRRSLSSLVEKLLADYCREMGHLKPQQPPSHSKR